MPHPPRHRHWRGCGLPLRALRGGRWPRHRARPHGGPGHGSAPCLGHVAGRHHRHRRRRLGHLRPARRGLLGGWRAPRCRRARGFPNRRVALAPPPRALPALDPHRLHTLRDRLPIPAGPHARGCRLTDPGLVRSADPGGLVRRNPLRLGRCGRRIRHRARHGTRRRRGRPHRARHVPARHDPYRHRRYRHQPAPSHGRPAHRHDRWGLRRGHGPRRTPCRHARVPERRRDPLQHLPALHHRLNDPEDAPGALRCKGPRPRLVIRARSPGLRRCRLGSGGTDPQSLLGPMRPVQRTRRLHPDCRRRAARTGT